jgi:hypothetical protein
MGTLKYIAHSMFNSYVIVLFAVGILVYMFMDAWVIIALLFVWAHSS